MSPCSRVAASGNRGVEQGGRRAATQQRQDACDETSPCHRHALPASARTFSARASEAVRPGDSMPKRLISPGDAVLRRPLDREILRRRALRHDLGPNAGIARLQRAVLQRRPVFAHGGVELVGAVRIDRVVDARDPFDIGPELRLAAEIDGDVHAEPARHRDGIDQAREGRAASQGEIVSFGVIRGRDAIGWHAIDFSRQRRRMQAGRIDHQPARGASSARRRRPRARCRRRSRAPRSTGLKKASIAPLASASPCSASM